ncbi:MAG: hypothetical protein IH851_12890 [Armatimonadetes bacterium]|nr:hypothetical protein [Armatimonadota bacterium]
MIAAILLFIGFPAMGPDIEGWIQTSNGYHVFISVDGVVEEARPLKPASYPLVREVGYRGARVRLVSNEEIQFSWTGLTRKSIINLRNDIKERFESRNFGAPHFRVLGLIPLKDRAYAVVTYDHPQLSGQPSYRGGIAEIVLGEESNVTRFALLPSLGWSSGVKVARVTEQDLTLVTNADFDEPHHILFVELEAFSVTAVPCYDPRVVDRETIFAFDRKGGPRQLLRWDIESRRLRPAETKFPLSRPRFYRYRGRVLALDGGSVLDINSGRKYTPELKDAQDHILGLYESSVGLVFATEKSVAVLEPGTLRPLAVITWK